MNSFNHSKDVYEKEGRKSDNAWLNAMDDVDDFSEHMKKIENLNNRADTDTNTADKDTETSKTQRALEKIGATESRSNEVQFENDIKSLDTEGALRLVKFINGAITGKNKYERRTLGYGIWGGAEIDGHLSPAPEVQQTAIEETLDAIKDMKDNHKRAALVYYMTNHLHLFNDGNGRTARTLYEVFDKKDFKIIGSDFVHQTNGEDEVGNRENFTKERGLLENRVVSNMMLDIVREDLVEEQELPEEMLNSYYSLNLPVSDRSMPDVYLTNDAEQGLSNSEKNVVRNAFFEKPIATMALGIMLKKKGNFKWAVSEGSAGGPDNVLFEIENKDKSKAEEVFSWWEADDYRNFCGLVKDLQLRQARKLIDVFKNEDGYVMPNGKTYADILSGNNNT